MKKLLKYLKPYKKQVVLAPLTKFVDAFFELLIPFLMSIVIDEGIGNANKPLIYGLCGVMVVLVIVGFFCTLFCQYSAAVAGSGMGMDMRNALLKKIERMDERTRERVGAATLVNRCNNDVQAVSHAIAMFVRMVLRAPFLCVGGIVMALVLDVRLSLILAVFVPLLVLFVIVITRLSILRYKSSAAILDTLSVQSKEAVHGSHIIRAFCQENEEQLRFEAADRQWQNAEVKAARTASLLSPGVSFLMNSAVLLILWIGGLRIEIGGLSTGKLIAFLGYVGMISSAVVAVANLSVVFMRGGVSAARLNTLLDSLEESAPKSQAEQIIDAPLIELRNAGFAYESEYALEDISFKLDAGSTLGIIGSTGGGKTTLIKLIMGAYLGKGDVLIKGKRTQDWDKPSLRALFGYAPQRAGLFSGTILSNIQMGKSDITQEEAMRICKMADLDRFVLSLPEGLLSPVYEGGQNLSGGQRQRLSIARALAKEPQVLIFDDSLSALDTQTEARIRNNLKDFKGAIIIVSQRVKSVMSCDSIAVLDSGRLAALGSHEQLLQHSQVYRQIAQSQNELEEEIEL